MPSPVDLRNISRRDLLKGLAATAVGAAVGAAAHGYLYERKHI